MTVNQINNLEVAIIGKSDEMVNSILNQEDFIEVDRYVNGECGYVVKYCKYHQGIFTVMFDHNMICQDVNYRY